MSFMRDVNLGEKETASNIEDSNSFPINRNDLPPSEEILGSDDEGLNNREEVRRKRPRSLNNQLEVAEKLAEAIKNSTPVINFPSFPNFSAHSSQENKSETDVFSQLLKIKLDSIEDEGVQRDVMHKLYIMLDNEINMFKSRQ